MILNENKVKRKGIYFFYDKDGIVDQYVPYMLERVHEVVDEILIICNGQLNLKGQKVLEKYGEVLVRENKGYDVWAYKEALYHIGWEQLEKYDEILLMNSTIMGPVFPLDQTFKQMSNLDVDFWGITKYFKIDYDPFKCSKYGYLPDHIQSHFIVCRKSLVQSDHFHEYWDKMPMINSYEEAIGKHEAIFTKHFEDLGFKWDVSVDTEYLREYSGYPLLMCPTKIMKEKQCPIFKKRSFFHNTADYLRNTLGQQTTELYDYLKNETNYDVNMIWETILRNSHQCDIQKNMNLTYILPTNESNISKKEKQNHTKVALVMHIYFLDLIEEMINYASFMPLGVDIYITTDNEKKRIEIKKFAMKKLNNKVEVRLVQNRGRDVSSLLVGVKDVIMNYDIACFVHDKKTTQVEPGTVGTSFAYKCLENIVSNENYVKNIIRTFEENPKLGLLSPPEPNHNAFFQTIGNEWGPNYEVTKNLAKKLELKIPMSPDKQPIAPFGTMFWFRTKAMDRLYSQNWEYEDFPEEPNGFDGTILHAIERIYPFVVQEEGYYPAICMTDKFAAIEYGNLRYYVRSYNKILLSNGIEPYQDEMTARMAEHFDEQSTSLGVLKWQIKRILKKHLPRKIYTLGGKIKRVIHG